MNEWIGLTLLAAEEKAKKEGLNIRLASVNGENFVLTCDYVLNRINLDVNNGVVVGANFG